MQVQTCCERSGQSSFVVDTRYHLQFDVASFTFDNFFKDQVTNNKVAPVHMVLPCSPFTSGEGRNNRVLRSFEQPCGVNDLSHDLQVKVAEGNKCARAVVDVLTLCLHDRISDMPRTSQNIIFSGIFLMLVNFCNVEERLIFTYVFSGSPWRKYTRFFVSPVRLLNFFL